MRYATRTLLIGATVFALAACNSPDAPAGDGQVNRTVAKALDKAHQEISSPAVQAEIERDIDKAKQELAQGNIDVSNIHVGHDHGNDRDSRPRAQITPAGDLLIGGSKVAATPAQRDLLLAYRQQVLDIAQAGMDIGRQSAGLGMSAARAAILGKMMGKSDQEVEAAIKPETDRIEAAAQTLCLRMPALLAAQQHLGAAMPAFRPYATMQAKDVEDCKRDVADRR